MPTSSRSCAQHQKASCGVPTACQFGAGGAGVRPSTSGPAPAPCALPRAALQQIPPPPRQRFWKFTSEADQKGERRPRRRGRGQPPNAGASRLWRHTRPALRLTPALCATSPGQTEPSARRSRSGLPQPGPRTAPAWGPPRPGDGTGRADPAGLGRRRLWRGARCPGPAGARRDVPVPVSAPVPVPVPLLIPRRRWRLRR